MTAVFPVVVMLSDSCNVITETVTKSNIRKLDSLLGDTGIEVINECLFKDGNILMIDNLSTYLSFASKVLSGFDIIDTVTKSMLSNYPILTYYMNYVFAISLHCCPPLIYIYIYIDTNTGIMPRGHRSAICLKFTYITQ